jgi:GH25 family lysozyme M1 (1,4-beta-N-acetylmuramidase)
MERRRRSSLALVFAATVLSGCGAAPTAGDEVVESEEALRVCVVGATVEGVDVSTYQGSVNWAAVRSSGRRFAIARVSDGTRSIDATFARNWAGIKGAGMIRGAYQYFRAGQDPVAQADLVVRAVGRLGDGDLPVVLDLEDSDGQSSATVMRRALAWIDRVSQGTGKRPVLYTSVGFLDAIRGTAPLNDMTLWVANYGVSCPYLPAGFGAWTFWQYSDKGRVPGISPNVDTNVFNGTYAELEAFANGGSIAAPTPAAPTAATQVSLKWSRTGDTWAFDASSEASVTKVVLEVDGYKIGEATAATNFDLRYRFNVAKAGRSIVATAYDASGRAIGRSSGLIDSTQTAGRLAVQPRSDGSWEFVLEEAPSAVASVEVRADGVLLRDGVSGTTRSTRNSVRSVLVTTGPRLIAMSTYDTSGRVRGTITRTFVRP